VASREANFCVIFRRNLVFKGMTKFSYFSRNFSVVAFYPVNQFFANIFINGTPV
jgi:hypothetical protein